MGIGDSVDEGKAFNLKGALIWGSVSLLISGLCIYLVLRFTRNEDIWGDIIQVGLKTLALASGLVIASWLADGLRMSVLARAMGGEVGALEAIRISMMGSFMAGVTPFDTGGEPVKIYFLHKKGMSIGQSTAAVALAALFHATTRFFLWALFPIMGFILGFAWQVGPAVKAMLGLGVFLYVAFMVLLVMATIWPNLVSSAAKWICNWQTLQKVLSPERIERLVKRVSSIADEFRAAMVAFKSKKAPAALAFFLSLLYWGFIIWVPVLLLRSMGSGLSTMQIVSLSMTVYLVTAYVPTPGASGGAEVGSAVFFSPFLPARILGTFVVVWRLVTYYFTLLIGGGLIAAQTISWSLRKTDLQSP